MTHSSTFSRTLISSDLSPITATIHLPSLAHNLSELRQWIAPSCDILAVVKANAYGHGASVVAESLAQLGIQRFGVATVQEGITLRQQGITQPILVMGGLIPTQLVELIHHQLTPVITNEEITHHLSKLIAPHQMPYPVHIKVDTGMQRLGFSPEKIISFITSNAFEHILHIEGVMTHLADADNYDPEFTRNQLERFQDILGQIKHTGHSIEMIHAANSAGIMYHPSSHFTMVRPGLMLYGSTPRKSQHSDIALRPVMKVATHIIHIRSVKAGEVIGYGGSYRTTKSSKIAILPVGYAHGYSRSLSNKGTVLIQGKRVPIIGKICMDMMLVDVTNLSDPKLGEEVILLGQQEQEVISADEIAEWLDTIPYEVMCNIGTRSHHRYETI
ncbi:MAG: alanine racemase [Nitrospirales bacterium]